MKIKVILLILALLVIVLAIFQGFKKYCIEVEYNETVCVKTDIGVMCKVPTKNKCNFPVSIYFGIGDGDTNES